MTLLGKRVLITRPQSKAEAFAKLLRAHGAQPLILPTIEICPVRDPGPLDRALENLDQYDWVIFTSTNAVEAVWERPSLQSRPPLPPSLRIAAIGPKTARSLQNRGVQPDHIPHSYIAEAIVPGLGELRGCRVLLPVADIAKDTLPKAVRKAGGTAEVVTAYRTIPSQPNPEGGAMLDAGLDAVTFTSGSTVQNFINTVERYGLDARQLPGSPVIACIGPKTAQIAQENGLGVDIVPGSFTVDGLVKALQAFFTAQMRTGNRK